MMSCILLFSLPLWRINGVHYIYNMCTIYIRSHCGRVDHSTTMERIYILYTYCKYSVYMIYHSEW